MPPAGSTHNKQEAVVRFRHRLLENQFNDDFQLSTSFHL